MADAKAEKVEQVEYVDDERRSSFVESATPLPDDGHKHVYSPEEKHLKHKIDRVFVPLLYFVVFIQFLDKSILNVAAVMNIKEDAHLSANDYSWLGSMFYAGYLAFQLPNHYLMHRVPISKYMGGILFIWGTTLMCTSQAKSFATLAVCRLLLGIFEAITYPCIFLLISMFYRRHEQVLYLTLMFVSNSSSSMIGGLVAYGIEHLQGVNGLSAWQYAYLIWGSVTFALGIAIFTFLPDKSKSRWFSLTKEEEVLVEERLKDNGSPSEPGHFNKAQIYEALKEGRFYAICAISFLANLTNGCTTVFSTQIVNNLGFDNFQSILMNIPISVFAILSQFAAMWAARRYREVCYVGMGSAFICLIGCVMLAAIPDGYTVKIMGLYLAFWTTPAFIMMQTLVNNNVKGTTKKTFYSSAQLCAYSLGNFIGPICLLNQAPRYTWGMTVFSIANFIEIFIFAYIRWSLMRDQRRRKDTALPAHERQVNNLTDKEDLTFSYRP
ncbi:major facilitator superfamily domain-containing protein [Gongronella butleri]|nr:major facilitator superfamily domain-containing protein [Gongronella butleri]